MEYRTTDDRSRRARDPDYANCECRLSWLSNRISVSANSGPTGTVTRRDIPDESNAHWATGLASSMSYVEFVQLAILMPRQIPGIVVSDRWNGYEHLDPDRRQVCWSHL